MTHLEFAEVVAGLSRGDFTQSGTPKMAPLNAALVAAGHDPMSAGARDEMMAKWQAAADAGDLPPVAAEEPATVTHDATVVVTIHDAGSNPLPLYVHGVGRFSLRIGEPTTLPEAALDALNNAAGITYSIDNGA